MEIFVHDTAFMIAYYRAQHLEISQDPYAKLWLRPGLDQWAKQIASKITEHDDLLHCLRNRFFYTELKTLWPDEEKILFLNMGAGFSMYPYLLPDKIQTIELDFEEIALYKSEKTSIFTAEKLLPKRSVEHWNADITDSKSHAVLLEKLAAYSDYKKVVLIEGVFFFLTEAQIDAVLSFCSDLLNPGDILMCVSFDESQKETAVFKRLIHYFADVLKSADNPFSTLPHSHYKQLDGFKLIKQSSSWELGQKLEVIPHDLKVREVLNEHFYIMERK